MLIHELMNAITDEDYVMDKLLQLRTGKTSENGGTIGNGNTYKTAQKLLAKLKEIFKYRLEIYQRNPNVISTQHSVIHRNMGAATLAMAMASF
jgi:hypothetical protein